MKFVDFTECELFNRAYDGLSGAKLSILYHGEPYLLKFPKNLKKNPMKNIVKSYSDAPICEYLGSHVYANLGIPVHQTILGKHGKKLVVACKDFCKQGDILQEFFKLKTTMEPPFMDEMGNYTDGQGTEFDEVLQVISEHRRLKDKPEVRERFWDMLIVDSLIGNGDRNNGNWGIILRYDGSEELAPVYDNGAAFNNKWDDQKILRAMEDENNLKTLAYKGITCAYVRNGKDTNPFHILQRSDDEVCLKELHRLIPKIIQAQPDFIQMVNELRTESILSQAQADFFKKLVDLRIREAFIPIYKSKFKDRLPAISVRKGGK